MSRIVLKLGGSVLREESSLIEAVHEIYRWRRQGWQVLAVSSALAGRTDALLDHADALFASEDSSARASLVAQGERECAALLALYLERAGLPARCLTPRLLARGAAHDAEPVGLHGDELARGLEECGVVVCPGYVAQSASGESLLLGRGGSDLSAVFLAAALGAERVRLIKDVDGLYDRDPAVDPAAVLFTHASYAEALGSDGSILQHKAIQFAQRRGLRLEIAGWQAPSGTTIGAGPSRFAERPARASKLRVGLLGHGHVGAGVAALLARDPRAELIGIATRSQRQDELPASCYRNGLELVDAGADVLIELVGGIEFAGTAIEAALRRRSHVITANKQLLARRGDSLAELAREQGVELRYSAAVGGAVPILESMPGVVALEAILCGTANFVLDRCDAGLDLAAAVAEAQRLGYAEADPSEDLDGRDAAAKLCVLSRGRLRIESIPREAIEARRTGRGLRQVARLWQEHGSWRGEVRLIRPDAGSPLAALRGAENAAVLHAANGSCRTLKGGGAGRWPTSESVYSDFLDLWRLLSPVGERSCHAR